MDSSTCVIWDGFYKSVTAYVTGPEKTGLIYM